MTAPVIARRTVVPNELRFYRESVGVSLRAMSDATLIDKMVLSETERQLINLTDENKLIVLRFFQQWHPDLTLEDVFFRNN